LGGKKIANYLKKKDKKYCNYYASSACDRFLLCLTLVGTFGHFGPFYFG